MNIVILDFETFWDQDYTLSKISTEQYVRDPRFEVIGVSIKQGPEAAQWFSDPLEVHTALNAINWSESALLAHNTYFDGAILGWHFGIYPAFYLDTMSMARPRFNMTCGTSLAALSKAFEIGVKGIDAVTFKGYRRADFTAHDLAQYGRYCCNDVELTWRLFQKLREQGEHEFHLINQYIKLFVEPLLQVDDLLLQDHLLEVQAYREAGLNMAAYELGIEPEKLKQDVVSNEKFAKLLESIGVDPPKKISPTTGKVTWAFNKTDQGFIEMQEEAENDPDTLIKTLIGARVENKSSIEETRTNRLIGVASRGMLPVYLGHYQAHTGRAGGGDMINLQNLPVRDTRYEYPIRQALCAPPDHECISADLAQIEARILAWLAGQQDVVEAFRAYDEGRGPDIYCVTASTIFGRTITRGDEKERMIGKIVRLALGYGMSHVKFARVAKVKQQEAYDIVTRHRQASRHIVDLWDQGNSALRCILVHEQGVLGKHGALRVSSEGIHLPKWGRVIRYPNLTHHARCEEHPAFYTYQNRKKLPKVYGAKVIENCVQALAGIVVAEAWLRLVARGLTVVLQVHDELVCVAHKNDVDRWLPVIKEEMTRVPDWAPGLPVACTIGHDPRYGLAKG
jgi:DNA polymerase